MLSLLLTLSAGCAPASEDSACADQSDPAWDEPCAAGCDSLDEKYACCLETYGMGADAEYLAKHDPDADPADFISYENAICSAQAYGLPRYEYGLYTALRPGVTVGDVWVVSWENAGCLPGAEIGSQSGPAVAVNGVTAEVELVGEWSFTLACDR